MNIRQATAKSAAGAGAGATATIRGSSPTVSGGQAKVDIMRSPATSGADTASRPQTGARSSSRPPQIDEVGQNALHNRLTGENGYLEPLVANGDAAISRLKMNQNAGAEM